MQGRGDTCGCPFPLWKPSLSDRGRRLNFVPSFNKKETQLVLWRSYIRAAAGAPSAPFRPQSNTLHCEGLGTAINAAASTGPGAGGRRSRSGMGGGVGRGRRLRRHRRRLHPPRGHPPPPRPGTPLAPFPPFPVSLNPPNTSPLTILGRGGALPAVVQQEEEEGAVRRSGEG